MRAASRQLGRTARAFATFLRGHWRTLLADAVALAALALGLLVAVHLLGLPSRAFHVALLVSAVGYALLADWWEGD